MSDTFRHGWDKIPNIAPVRPTHPSLLASARATVERAGACDLLDMLGLTDEDLTPPTPPTPRAEATPRVDLELYSALEAEVLNAGARTRVGS